MSIQKTLSRLRKAITDYEMIKNGDKIAIGVSGGKDSLVLLLALAKYKIFSPEKFDIIAISIDLTRGKTDFSQIKKMCQELDVEYHIVESDIKEIIFDERKEKNPCSLCSKMRRGILNSKVIELGCNKIALGHHADDLIETLFLSMFYEGRLSTFQPVSYMDKSQITLIRPLIYEEEKNIKSIAKTLPVLHNECPADKHTRREYIKKLIKDIQKDIPFVKDRIFGAITNPDRTNLFPTKKDHN